MGLLGGSVEFMLTALLLINGIICVLLPFILPAVVGRGGFEIYLNVAQNISLVMLLPLRWRWRRGVFIRAPLPGPGS